MDEVTAFRFAVAALVGMLGVFWEFERAMIRDRVLAGLHRARNVDGKRLWRSALAFAMPCVKAARADVEQE